MRFAKACHCIGATERSAVAIMGFNAPEWAISFIGGIMNNNVNTGIYITNQADAVLYQTKHSEAEVIVVETADHLKRFTDNLEKYDSVKAFVIWGVDKLPIEECLGNVSDTRRFFLWKDFLQLSYGVKDDIILAKMRK